MTDPTNDTAPAPSKIKKTLFALALGMAAGAGGALLFMRFVDGATLGGLGTSREIAGLVGLIYAISAVAVLIGTLFPKAGATYLNAEDAEELREQKSQLVWSFVGMAAVGAILILAALAAPVGPIAPGTALIAIAGLLFITVIATIATYRMQDELMRAMGKEAAVIGYYLLAVVGGGWALLAHLGFTAAPAPLDWLTMFWVTMLAGVFVAIGQRGLMTMR